MGYTGEGKDRNIWQGRLAVTDVVPVASNDLVTKFYADSNDFWQRVGTILSPKTAGDDITTTGKGTFGELDIAGELTIDPDGEIITGSNVKCNAVQVRSDVNGIQFGTGAEIKLWYDGTGGTFRADEVLPYLNFEQFTALDFDSANLTTTGTATAQDITVENGTLTLNATDTRAFTIKQNTSTNGLIMNTNDHYRLQTDGITRLRVNDLDVVATETLKAQFGGVSMVIGADNQTDTLTNNTLKTGRITMPHYVIAEEPVGVFLGQSSSTFNSVVFGGGSSLTNAATQIDFYTAATTTTQTGTLCYRITHGLHDFKDGIIVTTNRIVSGAATISASSDITDVSGINTLYIDITGDIILGGLKGGVDNQQLNIVMIGNFINHVTLEHAEGIAGSQDFINHLAADENISHGGCIYVCKNDNWYDLSHARYV